MQFFEVLFAGQRIKKFKEYSKKFHYPIVSLGDEPVGATFWGPMKSELTCERCDTAEIYLAILFYDTVFSAVQGLV